MNATADEHPRKDQLVDFGLGKLTDQEAAQIGEHLESCPDCQLTISDLHDDTFVALVRDSPPDESASDAGQPSHSISPDVTVAPDSTMDANHTRLGELPRELREHPRYEILELIGRGGMGDVYRAQHKVMNRVVALKVIKPELVHNETAVARFRREVQAAARLHHANIVTAFDAEQAGDVHFLVMEFVDGVNLDEVLRQGGPLSVAEACECIRQTAIGLQSAHELGMVHRDVKPHNLIRATDKSMSGGLAADAVKILDFGLANFASESAEELIDSDSESPTTQAEVLHQLTEMGSMMGTPDFVAPEQAEDAHKADIRADIYSLGCTFFTLLTGRAPFATGTVAEKIRAHAKFNPPPLVDYRTDVPQVVEAVLRTMMAKDPNQRYQTPGEVATALEEVAIASRPESLPEVNIPPEPTPALERAKTKPYALVALAMVFAVAISFAGVLVYVATDTGKIEIDNRAANMPGARIVLTKGGKEYATFTLEPGSKTETIRAGEYEISVQGIDSNVELNLSSKRVKTNIVQLHEARQQIAVFRGDDLVIEVSKRPVSAGAAVDAIWELATNAEIQLDSQEQHILEAAENYLALRDKGDFDKLYSTAATYTRSKVSREHFERANQIIASGFGKVTQRKLVSARLLEQLRGLPAGDYAGLEFNTDYELQQNMWESVLLVKEADDRWRVHSYGSLLKRIPFSGDLPSVSTPETGLNKIGSLEGHAGPVKDIKYSHNGKWLASGSGFGEGTDQTVRIWDLASGALKHTLEHDWPVMSVCFSADDQFVYTCGRSRSVCMWRVADGTLVREFSGDSNWLHDVAVSPDGKALASCGSGGFASVWDTETGELRQLEGGNAMMLRVRFSPDSSLLFGANRNGQIATWEVGSGQLKGIVPETASELRSGCGMALLQNGKEAIVGAADGIVRRWNLETGKLAWSTNLNASIQMIAATPDERTAIVCGSSSLLTLIDISTGEVIANQPSGLGTLWALAIAPSGEELAIASGSEWRDGGFRLTGDYAVHRWSLPERASEGDRQAAAPDNQATRTNAARKTALRWLEHADQAEYEKCHPLMSDAPRNGPTSEEIVAFATAAREMWGTIKERREVGCNVSHAAGFDLVQLRYRAKFEKADSVLEMVALRRESNGKWSIMAYAARNGKGNLPIEIEQE